MQTKLTYGQIYAGDGYIVVDGLQLRGSATVSPRNTTPPPLRDRLMGAPAMEAPSAESAHGDRASTPWGGFEQSVFDSLTRALGTKGVSLVGLECPSLDNTELGWYATTGAVDAVTDPIVFTPAITGASAFGRDFAAGDYVMFVDPAAATGSLYSYEIAKITAISLTGEWTVQRRQSTSAAGFAAFGTPMAAHAAGINIVRVIDQFFFLPIPFASPQLSRCVWEDMTVAAVVLSVEREPDILVNLIPTAPSPAAAGLDTGLL